MKPFSHLKDALAVFLAGASSIAVSSGAVTYVDPADIVIPLSFGGVYLDFETETETGSTPGSSADLDSFTISYSEPSGGDWDVNFFFGGAFIAHSPTFQPYRSDPADNLSAIDNLGLNTEITGAAVTPVPATGASAPLTVPGFGASGTTTGGGLTGAPSATHMGPAADQFTSGTPGYIGFVLNPDTAPQYGWLEVTLNDDGSEGTIHRWAYSDSPLAVGVPEPGVLSLLVIGGLAMVRRRRGAE